MFRMSAPAKASPTSTKSLESWIWDAACSIRGAEPGMEIYDPTCGSLGLLIKCELAMERGFSNPRQSKNRGRNAPAPLKLFGQEYIAETWAMANMNMIIHDMEGQIEIGDTFRRDLSIASPSPTRFLKAA